MPTFFGIDRVVPRRALRDAQPCAGSSANDARACLAALQGGQAGALLIERRPEQLVLLG